MAQIKITDLAGYTDPVSTDVLPIVDITSDVTKKVSIADLMENAGSGTEALPGISFDGDPNTGIYRPDADQLALSTAGTQRIHISATGVVTIPGDLTVNGTTTTINTETLVVKDKNIELAVVATPTDVTADGGGITLKGTTDKTINWVDATDAWTSSEHINLASGKKYYINGTEVLSATSLGSAVQISSANIPSGTIVNDDVNASAAIAGTKISPDFGSQTVQTTGVISHALGTAGAPTVTFTGDTNTGIYSPGADQVAISTGGSGRLFINASGNVGVGVASPVASLSIYGDSVDQVYGYIENNNAAGPNESNRRLNFGQGGTTAASVSVWQNAGFIESTGSGGGFALGAYSASNTDPIKFYTGSARTEKVRITSDGKLGLGTSSPSTLLHLSASNPVLRLDTPAGASSYARIQLKQGTENAWQIFSGGNNSKLVIGIDAQADFAAIDNSGRVGIGTTSPGDALTVQGTGNTYIGLQSATAGYASLKNIVTSTAAWLRTETSHPLYLGTNGTRAITIDTSQNVGIGTTSPGGNLHVNSNDNANTFIASGSNGRLRVFGHSSGFGGPWISATNPAESSYLPLNLTGSEIVFAPAGTERARIDSSGRLGLGTSSPSSLLTVGLTGTANPAATAQITGSDINLYRLKLTSSEFPTNGRWLGLGFGYTDNYMKAGIIAEAKDNQARVNLHFCLDSNAGTDNADLSDSKMVITYGGNVGIGTTSPSGLLHVYGSGNQYQYYESTTDNNVGSRFKNTGREYGIFLDGGNGASNSLRFYDFTASAERMRIDSSGRVGIGTTPSYKLDVNTGSNDRVRIVDGASATLELERTGAKSFLIQSTNDSGLRIYDEDAGSERCRVDTSGRLLVGTSTSRGNFYNSGSGYAPLFQVEGTAAYSTNQASALSVVHNSTDDWGGTIYLGKSKSSSVGGNGLISSGDTIGRISFQGADGSELVEAARIDAMVDGTSGANDMPGRLVFSTTADSQNSPTERVRIQANGQTKFSGSTYGVEQTITAGTFNMAAGNFFTVGAVAIPNPTNATAGMSGLIRITAAPTSWGSNFDFPGGAAPTIASFPAIIPFYVQSSTVIMMGNVTEGIA